MNHGQRERRSNSSLLVHWLASRSLIDFVSLSRPRALSCSPCSSLSVCLSWSAVDPSSVFSHRHHVYFFSTPPIVQRQPRGRDRWWWPWGWYIRAHAHIHTRRTRARALSFSLSLSLSLDVSPRNAWRSPRVNARTDNSGWAGNEGTGSRARQYARLRHGRRMNPRVAIRSPFPATRPCRFSAQLHSQRACTRRATTGWDCSAHTRQPPTDQPTNQPTDRPTDRPTNQPTDTRCRGTHRCSRAPAGSSHSITSYLSLSNSPHYPSLLLSRATPRTRVIGATRASRRDAARIALDTALNLLDSRDRPPPFDNAQQPESRSRKQRLLPSPSLSLFLSLSRAHSPTHALACGTYVLHRLSRVHDESVRTTLLWAYAVRVGVRDAQQHRRDAVERVVSHRQPCGTAARFPLNLAPERKLRLNVRRIYRAMILRWYLRRGWGNWKEAHYDFLCRALRDIAGTSTGSSTAERVLACVRAPCFVTEVPLSRRSQDNARQIRSLSLSTESTVCPRDGSTCQQENSLRSGIARHIAESGCFKKIILACTHCNDVCPKRFQCVRTHAWLIVVNLKLFFSFFSSFFFFSHHSQPISHIPGWKRAWKRESPRWSTRRITLESVKLIRNIDRHYRTRF